MSWGACFKDENEKEKSNESLNLDYEKARKVLENLTKGEIIKIGRSDLCPCGSGKKYKKCCGK